MNAPALLALSGTAVTSSPPASTQQHAADVVGCCGLGSATGLPPPTTFASDSENMLLLFSGNRYDTRMVSMPMSYTCSEAINHASSPMSTSGNTSPSAPFVGNDQLVMGYVARNAAGDDRQLQEHHRIEMTATKIANTVAHYQVEDRQLPSAVDALHCDHNVCLPVM